jgi:hypothetical protein
MAVKNYSKPLAKPLLNLETGELEARMTCRALSEDDVVSKQLIRLATRGRSSKVVSTDRLFKLLVTYNVAVGQREAPCIRPKVGCH